MQILAGGVEGFVDTPEPLIFQHRNGVIVSVNGYLQDGFTLLKMR